MLEEGLVDMYLIRQEDGSVYTAADTFGLSGTTRPSGLRIIVNLRYRGRIIDTKDSNKTLQLKHWAYSADDILP